MSAVDVVLMRTNLAVKGYCPGLLWRLALLLYLQLHRLGCHGEDATVAQCACFFWLL